MEDTVVSSYTNNQFFFASIKGQTLPVPHISGRSRREELSTGSSSTGRTLYAEHRVLHI